jgi:hypothetical protein
MNRRNAALLAGGMCVLMGGCYHGVPQKERIAYVGSTLMTTQDYDAFCTVSKYFPTPPEEFFLGARSGIGAMVETEAIYRKTRWNFANVNYRHGLEWKWRERYYIASLYLEQIVEGNYGFSDKELRKYYSGHKRGFSNEVITYDSAAKKPCTTSTVRPFVEIKNEVAGKMFIAVCPPDSAFKIRMQGADTNAIKGEWLRSMRGPGLRDYYMKKFFKEKYGRAFPDSLKDIYGKGKIISPDDMNVILSWMPQSRREQVKNTPQGLKDLAEWLIRWKLFAEKATATGYGSQPIAQTVLKWAWRVEIAQRYINEKLVPLAKKGILIDTAMCLYAYLDGVETPPAALDTTALKNEISAQRSSRVRVKSDSLLYAIRRSERVRFLGDWSDDKAKDPAKLIKQADSLRDTGNTAEAQNVYQQLVDNFFFTKEGKKAIIELAKIKTELQMYRDAITNYRRFLVADIDRSKQCNYMFMIGFIYDEYLNKPELAEINYKWVLKNAPDCELADDAEFMMLHLGEQMASVDELQAEVKRQGKKVEAAGTDTAAGLKVETMPAKQAMQ